MSRDKRYGAFLALSAAFLLFFYISTSGTSGGNNKPPTQGSKKSNIIDTAPVPSTVPSVGRSTVSDKARAGEALFPGFPININSATREELMMLPGIGEKTAGRIIEKRTELNGFRSVDDLTEVRWIGKVKLERIRGLITVNTAERTPRK